MADDTLGELALGCRRVPGPATTGRVAGVVPDQGLAPQAAAVAGEGLEFHRLLALDGLGRFTKMGGSILIMGLCGSAIVPLVYGYFADTFNTHVAYWVLMPCYLYLLYYAFYGYKVRYWSFR